MKEGPAGHTKSVLSRDDLIMRKIERCLTFFERSLVLGPRPTLYLPECNESVPVELGNQSTYRFVCALTVLRDVYRLIKTNAHRTKRGIYYDHKKLFGECTSLDSTLKQVCRLLNEPRVNLHVLSSSKGLLIGALKYLTKDGNLVNCQSAVVSVLPCVDDIVRLESDARFILVVEKDTIFQRLCQEDFHQSYSPCILVTAKGYPDYPTRLMLHKLVSTLKIPLFALVDCDPHGLEIYLTYKYGSSTHFDVNVENVDLTSIRWIGAFPSEIESLHIEQSHLLTLSSREKSKISSLLGRSCVKEDTFLEHQLRKMLTLGFKVELEAICTKGENFITASYFRAKLPKLLRDVFVLSET